MTKILLSALALAAMTNVALADAITPSDDPAKVTIVNGTSTEASELVSLNDTQMDEVAAGQSWQPLLNNVARFFGIPPGQLRQLLR